MASVNLRTVYAFAREMHSKDPKVGSIQYGKKEILMQFDCNVGIFQLIYFTPISSGTAGFRTL